MKNHQPNQKFSDEDFLKYYNMGLGDREIARKFNLDHSTVQHKRVIKFELLPNRKSYSGKEMNIPIFKEKRLRYLKYENKRWQKNNNEKVNEKRRNWIKKSNSWKIWYNKKHPYVRGSNQFIQKAKENEPDSNTNKGETIV